MRLLVIKSDDLDQRRLEGAVAQDLDVSCLNCRGEHGERACQYDAQADALKLCVHGSYPC
jgi:hypothetical protein